MSAVEWRHDGRRPILPVTILPPGMNPLDGIEVPALIDTGATASGISGNLAGRLGLSSIGKRLLASAHTDDHVDRYIFRVGLVPDGAAPAIPFVFEEVQGFRLRDGFLFEAIIGMDILGQCDLSMDRMRRCRLVFGHG